MQRDRSILKENDFVQDRLHICDQVGGDQDQRVLRIPAMGSSSR